MANEFSRVSITPPPVTLETAKLHLRLFPADTTHDADLTLKLQTASDYVLSYLKGDADPTWSDETLPAPVQAAILFYLELLFDHSQQAPFGVTPIESIVNDAIVRLLARYRDPGLA